MKFIALAVCRIFQKYSTIFHYLFLYDIFLLSFFFYCSTIFVISTSVARILFVLLYLSFLLGIVLSMVLRCGGAGMLRSSRLRHWRLNPLRAKFAARVRDLAGQAAHPGRPQGTIRRGRGSLHRRDRARAKGKASAPLAHAGKLRLGTDGRLTAFLHAFSSSAEKVLNPGTI